MSEERNSAGEKQDVIRTETEMPAYLRNQQLVSVLSGFCFFLAKKIWTVCTTSLLILLLIYWLYGSLITLALIIFVVIGFAYNAQDHLLYYPNQPPHSRIYVESPSMVNLSSENVFIRTKDGIRINALFIRQELPGIANIAPTIMYVHGNAGNIGHRLMNTYGLYTTTGCNILLVEYRGYGKSDGTPSEHGLYLDSEAAMDFLLSRNDINHKRIFIFGRSLGGAVAIYLSSQQRCANHICGLMIENSFTSLPDIGRHIFNFKLLKFVPDWCIKSKYPSRERICKVNVPTLFLTGLSDNLIPPKMMQELYDYCGSSLKRLARFESGTHNETWQCTGYYDSINRFLAEAIAYSGSHKVLDVDSVQQI